MIIFCIISLFSISLTRLFKFSILIDKNSMLKYQISCLSFIYLFLMLAPFTQCCDSHISTMTCQFYVLSNSSDCTNFHFQYCEWEVCDYYYTDSNNNSQCGQYSTESSNSWGGCLSKCCSNSDGPQTY